MAAALVLHVTDGQPDQIIADSLPTMTPPNQNMTSDVDIAASINPLITAQRFKRSELCGRCCTTFHSVGGQKNYTCKTRDTDCRRVQSAQGGSACKKSTKYGKCEKITKMINGKLYIVLCKCSSCP